MTVDNFIAAFSKSGLLVLFLSNSLAHSPAYSNKPSAVNEFVIAPFNNHNATQGEHVVFDNEYEQEQKYPDQHANFTSTKTSSISALTSSNLSSPVYAKSSLVGVSISSPKPSLPAAYVYKAVIPTHIEPVINKVVHEFKLSNATTPIANSTSDFSSSMANDNGLSKKIISSRKENTISEGIPNSHKTANKDDDRNEGSQALMRKLEDIENQQILSNVTNQEAIAKKLEEIAKNEAKFKTRNYGPNKSIDGISINKFEGSICRITGESQDTKVDEMAVILSLRSISAVNDLEEKLQQCVVTSVSVILNGNEPEFTDALGQKVPKPQPSLQVASPIDLLNPDRYEFYTFDEHGELVKRLMTMEEIQSIVANGDGEGPTIIHHGIIEDRDPQKHVQDIIDSVQIVLNKEVESNKNTSVENIPGFDTPDVSSSWSMILPAIFGNTGSVDVFSHQKPQQIVMTPDSEIIETSTKKVFSSTTRRSKPGKRKPVQKRKSTTTTTEEIPQIIQEELDSQESVYTGMQQYHNLAATMQNYDSFSQLHIEPLYQKLPEIEASTRRVFISNQEVAKKPVTSPENFESSLNENLAKKPISVQHKTLPPHIKKINGNHSSTKRPQAIKQKIKKKTTVTTSTLIPCTTSHTTTSVYTTTTITTPSETTTSESSTTTTAELTTTAQPITNTVVPTITSSTTSSTTSSSESTITSSIHTTKSPKKKKKKPTRHPVHSVATTPDVAANKPYLNSDKQKPSPKPHRHKPRPTQQHIKYPHTTSTADLPAEQTSHQEISNKFQHVSHEKQPEPDEPILNTPLFSTTTRFPPTTVFFSPVPIPPTNNPVNFSLVIQDFSGYQKTVQGYNESLPKLSSTDKREETTSADISATTGTSGYPVPSYDTDTDETGNFDTYQLKKQPLLSINITQNTINTSQEDVHTLQAFDQIMQTLKYQPQTSDQLTVNIDQTSEKLRVNPMKYDIAEKLKSSTTFKPSPFPFEAEIITSNITDSETTSNLSYQEDTTTKNENLETYNKITVRPISIFIADPPEDITTNNPIEKGTMYNMEGTDFPLFTLFSDLIKDSPEKSMEQSTKYQSHIKKSEAQIYRTPSSDTEQPTLTNSYEASTTTQGYAEDLKMETVLFPHQEEFVTHANKYTSHQIFVANLKPQLNMQVINPLEQINMSDFQTLAATVASTLIDSPNSLSSDYKNNSNDEVALLLSDVSHKISINKEESNKKVTNSNDNRFSNQAQLDLSFLKSPTRDKNKIIKTADYNSKNKTSNNQNYKPVFDRYENAQHKPIEIGNENKGSYFGTTKFPDTTTKTEKTYQTESINELSDDFSLQELEKTTTTVILRENDTKSEIKTELDKKASPINDPNSTSTFANSQHEKLEDDREHLFESDNSIDNTTLINGFLKETTSFLEEKSANEMIEQESLNESHNIKSSENYPKTESTVPIDLFNTAVQKTTTKTGTEELQLHNAVNETSRVETTEILDWTTTKSKNTLSTEIYRPGIYVTKMEHYSIPTDFTTENFKGEEEVTIMSTTSEKNYKEEENTFKMNERNDYTTAIYQISEETSAALNAMISEEDETDESINEDPYIKLGEISTLKPLEVEGQFILTQATEQDATTLAPQKSIQPIGKTDVPTETLSSLPGTNHDQTFEEADEEDEEDQFGNHLSKHSNHIFSTTRNAITTTPKPKITTTHRLNALKPVSYFNKKSSYILYQGPVEPLYNKNSPLSANTPLKVVTYSIPSSQQRPIQRPSQLSNLMISSTQSTRPPVKLEPSPVNSKGLEASLANLDEDILAFAKLCNELAFSYWKSITSEKISSVRSLVMSPFGLTSMLSMVFLGARGSTSGEMNDVLKLDNMVTFNPHLVFKNITDSVEKSIDSDIATTAFVREIYSDRKNGKILQFFKEKTQQLYAGHVEEVNFHVVNDIIRRRTNLLVKRHSMGKVLEYLRTNSVWVNGPLATISANLFQTDCSHGSTQDRDGEIFFQVHPTVRQRRLVPIPAVLFKSGFTAGYEPNLDATVVAFGHIQDTASIIYIMPGQLSSISPSDNLDRLEKQLMQTAISGNIWSNLLTSLMDRPGMEVQIPRFSHRSFVNATTGLQKMGLKGLFKSDYADLGGLTGSSNRDIYLSDMIQINTFSTCGEEKIADHHHVEMYPAPPLRKRNKDFDAHDDNEQDSSEAVIDFGSIVQESVIGRGFYDDLLDPKYLELPLPLRPRQARVPEAPRLRFDKPFLYFVRHNPTGMILFMGRFNPRLLP